MSIGEHLEDLRRRLIYGLLGVVVACCVTFYYAYDIVGWLCQPLVHAQLAAGVDVRVIATHVMTGFTLYMKVGLVAGLVLAGPWVIYQLWLFVAAGLYPHERRVMSLVAPFSTLMTVLGVVFFYYIMLPLALLFLVSFQTTFPMPDASQPTFVDRIVNRVPYWREWTRPGSTAPAEAPEREGQGAAAPVDASGAPRWPVLQSDPPQPEQGQYWIKVPENELRVFVGGGVRKVPLPISTLINPLIEINEYINFITLMGLGITLAFQVPVLMLIAGWTGLIDPRWIARFRRHVLMVCCIVAAILTPTADPFNLTLMAVPLWLLFEVGLIVMRLSYRRPAEEDAEEQ